MLSVRIDDKVIIRNIINQFVKFIYNVHSKIDNNKYIIINIRKVLLAEKVR